MPIISPFHAGCVLVMRATARRMPDRSIPRLLAHPGSGGESQF